MSRNRELNEWSLVPPTLGVRPINDISIEFRAL